MPDDVVQARLAETGRARRKGPAKPAMQRTSEDVNLQLSPEELREAQAEAERQHAERMQGRGAQGGAVAAGDADGSKAGTAAHGGTHDGRNVAAEDHLGLGGARVRESGSGERVPDGDAAPRGGGEGHMTLDDVDAMKRRAAQRARRHMTGTRE